MKKHILCFMLFLLSYPLYSQNLFIYNVDVSAYPTVQANFFAFDADWNQQILDQSDVVIKENGLTRTVYNFNCSTPNNPVVISCVLMLDVSTSMNSNHLGVAKECASAWVNALRNDKSECALTTFDHFNYFNQDFTTDKNKLLKAINDLSAAGGTDYNKALIDPMCGGLSATKTGKYQKILVLLTDGLSSSITKISKIIDEAKLQKCKIFVLTIDMKCPQSLKDISIQTGGLWFENINDQTKKDELFHAILHLAQGGEPCILPWKSIPPCDTSDINVELSWGAVKTSTTFPVPANGVHKLEVRPSTISFKPVQLGKSKDTIIKLSVKAIDYKILAINLKYGSNVFQIKNVNFPIIIPRNTNYNIPVRFTPTDSNYCYADFEIVTDYCDASFSCYSGNRDNIAQPPTLVLTRPNGGEEFIMNVDTLIEWDGVVPSDTVNLEYSLNNGTNWKKITDKATGLKYIWKEIPNVESHKCLIRVSQGCVDSIPQFLWQKTLGGSLAEMVSSFQATKDGGYIVAGWTSSDDNDVTGNRGMVDYWLVKLSPLGIIEWQKTYGGTSNDYATSVMQTSDDGYIVAGKTQSSDGQVTGYKGCGDYWIIKLNSIGALQWQKTLGGSAEDYANYIQQTKEGGYIVAGYSLSTDGDVNKTTNGSAAWIVKLDASGNITWNKIIGSENDKAVSIKQTLDGGYIAAVSHSVIVSGMPPSITSQYSLIKLDASGTTKWDSIYGGSKDDDISSVIETQDGGYIAPGSTNSMDGDITDLKGGFDSWIVKFNQSGKMMWQKTLGGSADDFANSIYNVNDGGYIVAGETNSNDGDVDLCHGQSDSWIVKLNSTGSIEWRKSFGGSSYDFAKSIIQTKDRGFAFISTTYSSNGDVAGQKGVSDYWIVKLGTEKYTLQSDQSDKAFSIIPLNVVCNDIDMKMCLFGGAKDSAITDLIQNTSNQKLRIDSIYFRGTDASAFSQVSVFPKYTLPIDGKHHSELRFKPIRVGVHNAEIVIVTQADTVIRKIQGEGVASQFEIINGMIDFGKVMVGSEKDTIQVVTIRNIGEQDINITNIKHNGPNLTDFTIIAGGESLILKPDEVIKMDLRFKPSDVGRTSGLLELYYDGVGSPIQIQLYGRGQTGNSQDLVSPENDEINVPVDCKLVWRKSIANSSYNLQISKNENFTEFVVDTTIMDTSYKCSNLDYFQLYYWRVKAFTGTEQSNWSDIWRFTTLMDSVNLLVPADLSKNIDLVPNLTWEKGIYKKDYRLQISKTADFATKIKDSLITVTNNADAKNLNYFTNYFWRVRNESGDTLGYWSKAWQFKTRMHDLTLVYPANTQTGLEQKINFKWSTVTGAEYYQLQISKNNQFTDLVYSKDSITITEHFVQNLETYMLYYWRVRVWNQETIGTAYWSEVWTFTTGETGVYDESELIKIIPNPADDFITVTLKPSEGFEPSEGSDIRIYNTLGEKVLSASARLAAPLRINISALPKGMYLVKAGGETAKFMKM